MSQTRRKPHEERKQYVGVQRAVWVQEGSRDCQTMGLRAGRAKTQWVQSTQL